VQHRTAYTAAYHLSLTISPPSSNPEREEGLPTPSWRPSVRG
jgi:hypothetical protein